MTRKQYKLILPVIEAFANGENVQFYDSLEITGTFTRGAWKTAESIGFNRPIEYYRMIKNGEVLDFK